MSETDRVNGSIGSLGIKAPVRVTTTENITLYGVQTIDGVLLAAEDRVLVKNQTSAVENGIYTVESGAWRRAPDFDGARDVVTGTAVIVNAGTAGVDSQWKVSTTGAIVPGTTALSFEVVVAANVENALAASEAALAAALVESEATLTALAAAAASSAGDAATSETNAGTSETNAALSEAAALAYAQAMSLNATQDTSASSVAIGTGAKTFTVTAGKSFVGGMFLVIADTAAPSTNSMYGQITSYSGTTLIINVLSVLGSGTKTAWTISQAMVYNNNALYAVGGKNALIAADTNLQTWADSLPAAGAYVIALTVAQGNLPSGSWYVSLNRNWSDAAGLLYHKLIATPLDTSGPNGTVYHNTCINGVWSGWAIPINGNAVSGYCSQAGVATGVNVASSVRNSVGIYTITTTIPVVGRGFSASSYRMAPMAYSFWVTSATTVQITSYDMAGNLADSDFGFVIS